MNSLPPDFESFCNQISWPLLAKQQKTTEELDTVSGGISCVFSSSGMLNGYIRVNIHHTTKHFTGNIFLLTNLIL